ncbi:hypothetical protein [Alienimonas sp. DA493]|uniref:hypothetical protein n=1 Tax=Alienimonas sp. DA493 TaxID=3373605 RepID=UPI003755016B
MSARPLPQLPEPWTVGELRWPAGRDAAIRWEGHGGTVRVVPSRVDDAELLGLIRRYRARVPADRQTGWPTFCLRVALPLVRCETPHRPLRSWERISDGSPSAAAVFVVVLAGELFGLALQLLTGKAGWLLLGPALTVAGLMTAGALRRFSRPRIQYAPPGETRATLLTLGYFMAFLLIIPAAAQLRLWAGWPRGAFFWIAFGLCAVSGGALTGLLRPHVRRMESFRKTAEADAVEEWDALHADPQREPRWHGALRGAEGTPPMQSDPDAGSVRVAESC